MKINRLKNRKKIIVISTVFLVLVGVGSVSAFYFVSNMYDTSNDPLSKSIDYGEPTEDQLKAGGDIKANSLNPDNTSRPNSSGSDQATAPDPQSNGKGRVAATMTAANRIDTMIQIRFDIGAVTNTGTCSLVLIKNAVTVKRSAGVQALAGSTSCMGFNVPINELAPGMWQVNLHFENKDLVADTTGSVTVK